MSRIGKLPITVPNGVTVDISPDNDVAVAGKGGKLTAKFSKEITLEQKDGVITLSRSSEQKDIRALHGLTRALLNNMVVGVSDGFIKTLEIVGVGYRAQLQGKKLVLSLGYSHPVEFEQPDGITFEVPDANKVIVKGIDKQRVGQVAANIRSKRPPEPYKGKGVKYVGEVIIRKEGK
ncbi:MAG TPA: 50S ribosomal protein L6, partial [Clostridiales bacterium]|nr:50S ribosomal protein L6 [Clostridiales bacterium]